MSELYDAICSQIHGREYVEDLINGLKSQPVTYSLSFDRLSKSSKILYGGSLGVIGGDSSCGKSLLVNSFIVDCYKQNTKCSYLPLESDKSLYLRRIACILNKNWEALSENAEMAQRAITVVQSELELLSSVIYENPALPDSNEFCREITPEYILTWAEPQFKNEVKVVIVDPMAQIDFQSTGRNQYQAENAFIQKAVTLSQRYNTCFVLVVHTVKSYDNHIPDMSNLQGGAALSRLASSIVILHNHDVESKRKLGNNIFTGNGYTKQAEFNKIIHVAKARNSEGSGVKIAFDFKNANFNEIGFFAPKSQLKPEPVHDKFTPYIDKGK